MQPLWEGLLPPPLPLARGVGGTQWLLQDQLLQILPKAPLHQDRMERPGEPDRAETASRGTAENQGPPEAYKCMHTRTHMQPARTYLGGAQQPLAVGCGGGGLSALAGLPWPLGFPPRPNTPKEHKLQPEEGHDSGCANPVHGAWWLQTLVVAQRCEEGHPGVLMGAAVQLALKAHMRGLEPRGRLASPAACAGRANTTMGRRHGTQQVKTCSCSRGPKGQRARAAAAASPHTQCPGCPRARCEINPPLLPKAPRGRAHALLICQPGGVDGVSGCFRGCTSPRHSLLSETAPTLPQEGHLTL